MLNEDLFASFVDLLDPGFQHHIIGIMKDRCIGKYSDENASFADLLEADISKPIKSWISGTQQERKKGNYSDIEAAEAFVIRADDIVYIMRSKTRAIYPEHVAMLNDAWSEFQRSIAYHLYIEIKMLSDHIRSQPDPEKLANEKLCKMREQAEQEIKSKRQCVIRNWQAAGTAGSKESKNSRDDVLLMIAKKILMEEKSNDIKSLAGFGRKIADRIKRGSFYYETAKEGKKKELKLGESSIRKNGKIITIHKNHFKYN